LAIVGGTPRGLEKVLETYPKVDCLTVRNGADQDAEIEPPGGVQIWPLRPGPRRVSTGAGHILHLLSKGVELWIYAFAEQV